jgi:hypothetical protein
MAGTQTSANLGMVLPGTTSPDVTNANDSIALITAALLQVDAAKAATAVQSITVAGAITITSGRVFLHTGTAGAITLAAPTAGLPAAGGNDGQVVSIVALDAQAYTVTTPANKINGNADTATWTAAMGNNIELTAFGGVWYTLGTPKGVALTEV